MIKILSIRTQDRMGLVPYDNAIHINKLTVIESGKLVYELVIDNSSHSLGTYATKERALEVLDEIEDVARHNRFVELVIPLPNYSKQELASEYEHIYQMPKE